MISRIVVMTLRTFVVLTIAASLTAVSRAQEPAKAIVEERSSEQGDRQLEDAALAQLKFPFFLEPALVVGMEPDCK